MIAKIWKEFWIRRFTAGWCYAAWEEFVFQSWFYERGELDSEWMKYLKDRFWRYLNGMRYDL